jgi:hypothetical protein
MWRDAHVAAVHVSLNGDAVGTMYGQYALGIDPKGQLRSDRVLLISFLETAIAGTASRQAVSWFSFTAHSTTAASLLI